MKYISAILCTILCFGPLAARAQVETLDLALDLTCALPPDGPDVDSGVVVARIYEYDPRLADVAAKETTKVTITGLTHKKGKTTEFRIPLHGKRSARRNYYVTVFVHPSSGQQRLYFINGFQKVFEGTDEQELYIKLKPTNKSRQLQRTKPSN